jgi:hypothetical protein
VRALRALLAATAALSLLAAGACAGVRLRCFRAPFPDLGKRVAWLLGEPEAAYNFDAVVPHRVYRSAAPDARFLRYLREVHGLERIVALSGARPEHALARELGIEVATFGWSVGSAPPEPELLAAIAAMEAGGPVLVHCASGSDRTGLAVAAYRIRSLGWSVERALAEMARYGGEPAQRASASDALRSIGAAG